MEFAVQRIAGQCGRTSQRVAIPRLYAALARHQTGDWGDVCEEDRGLNDQALMDGSRILSVYHDGETKFSVITEAADDSGQRAATTVLLLEDY